MILKAKNKLFSWDVRIFYLEEVYWQMDEAALLDRNFLAAIKKSLDDKYKLQDEVNFNIKHNNEVNNKLDLLNKKYNQLFDKYTKLDNNNKVNIFTKDIKKQVEEILNNSLKKNGINICNKTITTNITDIFNFLKSIEIQKKYKCI